MLLFPLPYLAGEPFPGHVTEDDRRGGAAAPGVQQATLMQTYGVARETARKAVRVLVGEGLVYVVQAGVRTS